MNNQSSDIDLGRDENDMGGCCPSPAKDSKPGKKRRYYPSLYIDSVPGLPMLPKEGWLMVKYRRKSIRMEENMDGKDSTGMSLEIRKIKMPEGMDEDAPMKLADAFKEPRKSKNTEDYSEDGEDE